LLGANNGPSFITRWRVYAFYLVYHFPVLHFQRPHAPIPATTVEVAEMLCLNIA